MRLISSSVIRFGEPISQGAGAVGFWERADDAVDNEVDEASEALIRELYHPVSSPTSSPITLTANFLYIRRYTLDLKHEESVARQGKSGLSNCLQKRGRQQPTTGLLTDAAIC
ncbi:MAG: hypothetical protein ACJA0Y_001017 [Maricaulis maris]